MVIEPPIDQTRARLRQSRVEIVALISEIKDQSQGQAPPGSRGFPRSLLMRAAMGPSGRMLLGGAALALAVLQPRLVPLVIRLPRGAPLLPLLRSVVNRYLVRRIIQ